MPTSRHLLRWLLGSWRTPPIAPRERQGYIVWVPTAIAIAVTEILGAADSRNIPWPTISHTVGQLEDRWHVLALVVVALIALVVYYGVAHRDRIPEPVPGAVVAETSFWGGALVYDLVVVAGAIAAGAVAGAAGAPKIELGYWIYGIFSFFGIIVPTAHAFGTGGEPTLFSTVRALNNRIPWFRTVLGVGMVILVLHLALYPWPDVTHESTRISGLNAQDARRSAEKKLGSPSGFYESVERGTFAGDDAWLVNFYPRSGEATRCTVAVRGAEATTLGVCPALTP
ncbi:MAG: hypothetical protein QOH00_2372 [Gaiellales bacterium]|jgi:hypothetical protein|nr:hypothetical protein [Gaiellales bacterium]